MNNLKPTREESVLRKQIPEGFEEMKKHDSKSFKIHIVIPQDRQEFENHIYKGQILNLYSRDETQSFAVRVGNIEFNPKEFDGKYNSYYLEFYLSRRLE